MNLIKYNPGKLLTPQKMNYTPQINEIGEAATKTITDIMHFYLMQNGKEVTFTSIGVQILSQRIYIDFGYLELQELEYALSCGVTGKYGAIYGAISLDMVIPWIQKYVEIERPNRPDPTPRLKEPEYTGKEMSLDEFYKSNPEYKVKAELAELKTKARNRSLTILDIKRYFEIVGKDYKTEAQIIEAKYNNEVEGIILLDFIKIEVTKKIINA